MISKRKCCTPSQLKTQIHLCINTEILQFSEPENVGAPRAEHAFLLSVQSMIDYLEVNRSFLRLLHHILGDPAFEWIKIFSPSTESIFIRTKLFIKQQHDWWSFQWLTISFTFQSNYSYCTCTLCTKRSHSLSSSDTFAIWDLKNIFIWSSSLDGFLFSKLQNEYLCKNENLLETH